MTSADFQQEFCCSFVDPAKVVFLFDVLIRAIDPNITELQL